MIDYEQFYSTNAKNLKKSEIRELLKFTSQPGVISFAGGLPAPDLFPVDEINDCIQTVMEREGRQALQYGPTEGNPEFRKELVKLLKEEGIDVTLDQLFVTTSSQQGLDLVGRVFISPGDIVMTGKPTYVGAIQAFHSYGANMCPVELDDEGIDTEKLDAKIKGFIYAGTKPKFIYVVPDFQNPSGITLSLKKRKELIAIAEKHDMIIIEDSPYRQLRFEGESVPTLLSLNPDRVVALYTFSKILLPGFRLGWTAGPKELVQKMIVAKQSIDLCAPPFNQCVLLEFLKRGLLEKQIKCIIDAYRVKRDFMLKKIEEYFPKVDGLRWTRPEGGLFLWVTLPEYMDSTEMFKIAVEKKVAYVMGRAFDPDGIEKNTMRLNFSFASEEQIDAGIARLAEMIKAKIK
ncbi:MAG: PLP-dependent aminotransferase family protein [bacterium]|nr:PLP-dependent aminotransferase family protein [bacterium]